MQKRPGVERIERTERIENEQANSLAKMEEQFILRVPNRVAEQIREMIANAENEQQQATKDKRGQRGPKDREIGVEFALENVEERRNVMFRVGKEEFIGTFVDLPCILESMKTYDNVNYYKSQDIAQMLLVHDPSEEDFPVVNYDSEYKFDSGITPPTRNIRKRKFRKPHQKSRDEIEGVEQEVLKIMRGGSHLEDESIEIVDQGEDDQEMLSPAATPMGFTPITTPVQASTHHEHQAVQHHITEAETSQDSVSSMGDSNGVKRKREKKEKREKKPKKSKLEKKEKKLLKKAKKAAKSQPPTGSFKISIPSGSQLSPKSPNALSPSASPISPGSSQASPSTTYSPVIPNASPSILSPTNEGLDALQKDLQHLNQNLPQLTDLDLTALKEEEAALNLQLTSLNRNISDVDARIKSTPNTTLRERFQKKKAEYEQQRATKLYRLQAIQAQLAHRDNNRDRDNNS